MEVRLLGSVGLWHEGQEIALGRPHRKCLLAILALTPNEPVPLDTLIDRIWGDRTPQKVSQSLYTHVSVLRKTLGGVDQSHAVARRSNGGYVLEIDPERIDLHLARRHVAMARSLDANDPQRDNRSVESLRAACALWRGTPLAGLTSDWADRARAALVHEGLALVIERFTLELRLGQHAAVVGPLAALVADHPLAEPLAGLLMLALYRCRRQSDALEVYAQTRQRLVTELGDEPSGDLQTLHQRILRRDPSLDQASLIATKAPSPSPHPPAQLPADLTVFTGRARQLTELDELRRRAGVPRAPVQVIAIDGMAGVGKTTLAVHWASRVRGDFRDGQLYVNLRGNATQPPLPVIDALARFLRAVGVPAEKVPVDADEAAAMYRSLLADKKVLVVLDDAANADQVRPLLPAGAGSIVLVTSRGQLQGLVVRDGAYGLTVDVLTPAEARTLLTRTIGVQRSEAEPEAIDELAELCGYLPLALRIAAAHVVGRPQHGVRAYANQLHGRNRVTAFAIPGDPQSAVAAAFDLSYDRLPRAAQRMFRLLALAPGPDIAADAAAAMSDITATEATELLDTLAGAHLINEHRAGRYTLHDLVRQYAAERAVREDAEHDRDTALSRLFDFYLCAVDAAARLLYPEKLRLRSTEAARPMAGIRDHETALAWLDGELPCLVAAVEHAASQESRSTAWLLADGLRGYFWLRRAAVDWLSISATALAAAKAAGDLKGEAATQLSLADAHLVAGRRAQATVHYQHALRAGRELGLQYVQSASLNNLGVVHHFAGRPREAAAYFREAFDLSRTQQNVLGQAVHLGNLGSAHQGMGQLRRAATYHTRSLAIYRRIGGRAAEAITLQELGETYHALGRIQQAIAALTEARSLHELVGDRAGQAETQRCIAAVYRDTGRPALDLATAALGLAREVGLPHVAADALNTLATVHQRMADHDEALARHRQALRIAQDADLGQAMVAALTGAAESLTSMRDYDEAYDCLQEAIQLSHDAGLLLSEGLALTTLVGVHVAAGHLDRVGALGERALTIHRETGHRLGEAHTHVVLCELCERTGRPAAARSHSERAHAISTAIGVPPPPGRTAMLLAEDAPAVKP